MKLKEIIKKYGLPVNVVRVDENGNSLWSNGYYFCAQGEIGNRKVEGKVYNDDGLDEIRVYDDYIFDFKCIKNPNNLELNKSLYIKGETKLFIKKDDRVERVVFERFEKHNGQDRIYVKKEGERSAVFYLFPQTTCLYPYIEETTYCAKKIDSEELEYKEQLLDLWDSYGFEGFLHTTNFSNFIKIYKSYFLKSRVQVEKECVVFEDNADKNVIHGTTDEIKAMVRFYYRTKTPTNIGADYSFGQKNPVLLVFTKNLIYEDNIKFTDGCARTTDTIITDKAKQALEFDWEEIFKDGAYGYSDKYTKKLRNAEFLIKSPVLLNKAVKFYFKNYSDYSEARRLFGDDERFVYNADKFYKEYI